MTSKTAENVVEIRVDDIAQLFHTLDPFPFRRRISTGTRRNILLDGPENCPRTSHSGSLFTCRMINRKRIWRETCRKPSANTSTVEQLSFKATSTSFYESGADP